jgi:hypothetical protein
MIQMAIWQPCAGLIMGIANKDRADIYKYWNFNQIESFKDMADTVKAWGVAIIFGGSKR